MTILIEMTPIDSNRFQLKIYDWASTITYLSALQEPTKLAKYIQRKYKTEFERLQTETDERVPKTERAEFEEVANQLLQASNEKLVSKIFARKVSSLNDFLEYRAGNNVSDDLTDDMLQFLNDCTKNPHPELWDE